MRKEQKKEQIEILSEKLQSNPNFYLVDISNLDAPATMDLRAECFKKGLSLSVVKNTLLKQALTNTGIAFSEQFPEVLKGNTAIIFTQTANDPARLIQAFHKKGYDRPVLKAAFLQESEYIGSDQLTSLAKLKSKEELLAEVIHLLQSPVKTVMSQLASSGNTISGLLQTLADK